MNRGSTDNFSSPLVKGRVNAANDGVGMPTSDDKSKFVVVVGTNVEYGRFLELGTSTIAPRPYLRPILEKYRNSIIKLLTK
jgi:hypothetical protein